MGFYYKEEVTDERKIYDKNRKEKRTKFWESGDFDKQDKVFAIYFKNDTLNKSETDFSERATFARIHKKKSPFSY